MCENGQSTEKVISVPACPSGIAPGFALPVGHDDEGVAQQFQMPSLHLTTCLFQSPHVFERLRTKPRLQLRGSRERVLFIGTQFSILYTSMYSPAEAATPRA
jgi:hypothetical protein